MADWLTISLVDASAVAYLDGRSEEAVHSLLLAIVGLLTHDVEARKAVSDAAAHVTHRNGVPAP